MPKHKVVKRSWFRRLLPLMFIVVAYIWGIWGSWAYGKWQGHIQGFADGAQAASKAVPQVEVWSIHSGAWVPLTLEGVSRIKLFCGENACLLYGKDVDDGAVSLAPVPDSQSVPQTQSPSKQDNKEHSDTLHAGSIMDNLRF